MTFSEAIAWALKQKARVLQAQDASLAWIAELRFLYASTSGKDNDTKKKLIKEMRRYGLLLRAAPSWQKLADIWSRGEQARLKVSFSGGKTSALMARRIKQELSHLFELVFVFANTGHEHDKTLIFVDRCDRAYDLDVKWLEAVVHHGIRESSGHRVVTFETASRLEHGDWNPNGWPTPFLEVIKKYGIPNKVFQPCNREMKLNTMDSYMESIGWDDYFSAVGIRSDEEDRLDLVDGALQIIYFMADLWRTDKVDVADDWEEQPFQLDLEEHNGNCVDCHKKVNQKLFRVYIENPAIFAWNDHVEQTYGWHGAPYHGVPQPGDKPRNRWRGDISTKQLLALAHAVGVKPFIPIKEERSMAARQFSLDLEPGGCSESCEAFPDELMDLRMMDVIE